jgi:hypothetical protein
MDCQLVLFSSDCAGCENKGMCLTKTFGRKSSLTARLLILASNNSRTVALCFDCLYILGGWHRRFRLMIIVP